MGERVKLTEAVVATLQPPHAGEVFHWDAEVAGFGVRLSAKGKRTWIVQWRFGAKQRRYKLGQWPELKADRARKQARDALAAARNGHDLQAAKAEARERAAVTLKAVAGLYLARAVEPRQRPRTVSERTRHLHRDWKPLHDLQIDRVDRSRIALRLAQIADQHGPIAANRSRGTLHALFAWAMGEGLASGNPVIGVNKPGQERSRDRVLRPWELALVWRATEAAGDYNAIVRLLLLTGQRREEIAGMRWSELNFENALWSLPRIRTKNKFPHDVPLSSGALRLIAAVPRRTGRDLVFGEACGPFSGWSQSKNRLDRRIAALRAEAGNRDRPDAGAEALEPWVLHDLRRTVVTGMAEIGIQPHVIEAVVNHVSGHKAGVAGVYNRATYAAEKRQALQRWGEQVAAVVEAEERRVVPLRAGG